MMFRSWRLYSWMRLIWMSNIASVETLTPVESSMSFAQSALRSCLASFHFFCSSASFARGASFSRSAVSVTHSSVPIASVITSESWGLQKASQRRGVTPLVLFWNFSG